MLTLGEQITYTLKHLKSKARWNSHTKLDTQERSLAQSIQKYGYAIIPNFIKGTDCLQWHKDVEQCFEQQAEHVAINSDQRLFGIERICTTIDKFAHCDNFNTLSNYIYRQPSRLAFTMGGKLHSGNQGSSGEGWHRDSCFYQFKAILYLTDVFEENGPLQMLVSSHHLKNILRDSKTANLAYMQNRLSDARVKKLLDTYPDYIKTFIAPAGTVILFDSSSIHRGSPIQDGERLTLTNYYYPNQSITPALMEKFRVIKR